MVIGGDEVVASPAVGSRGSQSIVGNKRRKSFDEHFEALKAFKAKFGHTRVP
eukprot:CAMPEP_0178714664 /NCGR_PEP_ID=MMETSP0699-20121125/20193_1 /TAXON_ID=265572 /ORGANISM="Extubocellulus spinifer, Strain CCMP396" /LENGTH=51 /DNA_ID=CAMNT_0020363811 /DNA_START=224 /DNA_END=376 /DNA_ORIENTATION=-